MTTIKTTPATPATPSRVKLIGDGTWPFHAWLEQPDITCGDDMPVFGTWFGGDADDMDSGETACGYPTKGHPGLLGCSLAMRGFTGAGGAATAGSPFPRMPWGLNSKGIAVPTGTWVRVWNPVTNKEVTVPLIDLGPAKRATTKTSEPHAIDLTIAAWKALGIKPSQGIAQVKFRILGGSKYVNLTGG